MKYLIQFSLEHIFWRFFKSFVYFCGEKNNYCGGANYDFEDSLLKVSEIRLEILNIHKKKVKLDKSSIFNK